MCQGNCNKCNGHLGDCKSYEDLFHELKEEVKKSK